MDVGRIVAGPHEAGVGCASCRCGGMLILALGVFRHQLGSGIPRELVGSQTMYIFAGILVHGLICNLLVRPLDDKCFMTDEELREGWRLAHEIAAAALVEREKWAG